MEAFPPEAAAALDAFDEAAGRPQAYLQPSKQVAELARLAAKVGLLSDLFVASGKQPTDPGTGNTCLALVQATACGGSPPFYATHSHNVLRTPVVPGVCNLRCLLRPDPAAADPV